MAVIVPTNFVPAYALISDIIRGTFSTLVETFIEHGFMPGLYVKIYIPYPNSMPEITHVSYPITIIDDFSFTIPVNSSQFTPFVAAPIGQSGTYTQRAQAVPTGELDTLANAVNNNLNN